MTVTGTNHGLSALTHAPADKRLQWPFKDGKTYPISTSFNDATSGAKYPQKSGHEGIDFACTDGTPVCAMYFGVVVQVENRDIGCYGKFVRIQSYTNSRRKAGFEHQYAHLSTVDIACGQFVGKGGLIGMSGRTGDVKPHLHVHLKPFDQDGEVPLAHPHENEPKYEESRDAVPPVATRILGCMNFMCFLPPDDDLPEITNESPLLSTRDAYACIDVYPLPSKDVEKLGTFNGSKIGCYAITGKYIAAPATDYPNWWQTQWEEGRTGWVPVTGPVGVNSTCPNTDTRSGEDVVWIQTHGNTTHVPAAWPPAPQELEAKVRGPAVVVSWEPSFVPPHMPQVTGYRVRRYGQGTGIFSAVDHQATFPWADPTADPDTGRITYVDVTGATPYALLFYEVTALLGDTEGARTEPPFAVIFAPSESGVYVTPQGPQGSTLAVRQGPGRSGTVADFTFAAGSSRAAVGYFQDEVGNRLQEEEWLRILQPDMDRHLWGWVPVSAVQGFGGGWRGRAEDLPRLPYLRLTAPSAVPVRTGPSFQHGATGTYLANTGAWYEVTGQNDGWWQVRVDSGARGWLPNSQVALTGATAAVPEVPAGSAAQPPLSEGHDADGDDMGWAGGQYHNLAVSWGGSWTVEKEEGERTVTASFRSDRSPVQYLADRQMDLLVLPAGLRPTRNQNIRVTGTHVHENGKDYTGRATHTFTLRVYTSGAVRYVDHPDLDQVGYLRYVVSDVTWRTARAAQLETRPDLDPLTPSGRFLNQQTNRGSYWRLDRDADDEVSGSFGSTRSPVDYHANDPRGREAILLLPVEYWPDEDKQFWVRNAIRVNELDGTDSTDLRRVDFRLTVQSNGEMWYDRDADLTAAGVGFLRFTVGVDWTARFARVQVPTAPRALEAEDVADGSLELDWRSPEDDGGERIEGYGIEYWDGDDEYWDTKDSDTDSRSTNYDVRRLDAHTRYSYRVRARNSEGWGPFGAAVTATTRRQKPAAPSSVAASSRHDRVTLAWTAPSGSAPVTGYRVQRRQGSRGSWSIVDPDTGSGVTHCVDRGVVAGTSYSYQVQALNYGEPGEMASPRGISTKGAPTRPGIPTALAVAPGTDSQLQLTWTEPSDTGGELTGYQVERSPDEMPRVWMEAVADTRSAAPTWAEDELGADTVYHYRVAACNSAGVGMPSPQAAGRTRPRLRLDQPVRYPLTAQAEPRADAAVTATFPFFLPERAFDLAAQAAAGWQQIQPFHAPQAGPFWVPRGAGSAQGSLAALSTVPGAPTPFQATLAANHEVTLSWTAPEIGDAVTGYRLWRQQAGGAWVQLGSDLAAPARTYTDTTVTVDHAYRYWLQALSAAGAGVPSPIRALAVMSPATGPATVQNLTAVTTATTCQLTWQRAAAGGLPAAYRVEWRTTDSDTFQAVTVAETTLELTDLRPDQPYEIRVTALNQEGEADAATQSISTLDAAPTPPTAVAVAVTGDAATATWQAPVGGGTAASYEVQSKTRTGDWPATFTTRTDRRHALTALTFGASYDLRVRACNPTGDSGWVTLAFTAGPERPGAVRHLAVGPGAGSQLQLTWDRPADTSVVTGYRIERAAAADPLVWVDAGANTGNTEVTWNESGLTADTTYHFRVTARSAAGLGTPAAAVPGTTRPQLTLLATATYPLTAHAWPATAAPETHTWEAHDATVTLDVVGQVRGTDGWYRGLRFGDSARGPFWLPASAVTLAGTPTDVPVAPGLPTALAHTSTHDTVTLIWTAPTTGGPVTDYRVWRQTGAEAWVVLYDGLVPTALSYTDFSLSAETTYQYRLQALSAAGAGTRTAAVSATTAVDRAPTAPTALSAAPGTDSLMQLAWMVPIDTGTQPLSGYRVERSADVDPRAWQDAAANTGSRDTTWDDSGLTADTVYHYQVSALSSAGEGDPSNEAEGRTRPQISLKAAATYPLPARAWPDTEAPTTHTWDSHEDMVQLDLVAQGPGGGGWYRALRFGAGASGPYWLPASAVTVSGSPGDLPQAPGVPGALTPPTATHAAVTLSWTAPATGGTVTGYRLWRQTGTGEMTVLGAELGADILTHTDLDVTASTAYQYRLQARAAAGYGVRTQAVSVTTPAGGNFLNPQVNWGSRWELARAGAAVSGSFRCTRSPVDYLANTSRAALLQLPAAYRPAADTRLQVTGAVRVNEDGSDSTDLRRVDFWLTVQTNGEMWYDRDAALTPAGVGYLRYEMEVAWTAPAQAPLAPQELAAAGVAATEVELDWDAPEDDGGDVVDAYRVEVYRTGSWRTAADDIAHTRYTVADLDPNTTYMWRVRAHNGAGWSEPSSAITVTTRARMPAAPTDLTATPTADSQLQLSWTAGAGGSATTGYRIERSADVLPRMWTEVVANTGNLDTTWADSGLAAATVYHYQVTGRNAAGLGTPAAAAPGTTRPQLTLQASVPYPLRAHAWPLATAPVTHTWNVHDAALTLDVMAQGAGGGGWYRVLRFGAESAGGPYWLPASAVTVTGSTTDLAQAPGVAGGTRAPHRHPRYGHSELDAPHHRRDP